MHHPSALFSHIGRAKALGLVAPCFEMSVILTLTSTMTAGATKSTTSGNALTDVLIGAIIASDALVLLLVLHYLMSEYDTRNANIVGALRTMSVPLVVIFCAFLAFTAAH